MAESYRWYAFSSQYNGRNEISFSERTRNHGRCHLGHWFVRFEQEFAVSSAGDYWSFGICAKIPQFPLSFPQIRQSSRFTPAVNHPHIGGRDAFDATGSICEVQMERISRSKKKIWGLQGKEAKRYSLSTVMVLFYVILSLWSENWIMLETSWVNVGIYFFKVDCRSIYIL